MTVNRLDSFPLFSCSPNSKTNSKHNIIFFKDALGELDTPGGASKPGQKVGTPLTDVIHRNLKVALANSTRNTSEMQAVSASPHLPKSSETKVSLNAVHLLNTVAITFNLYYHIRYIHLFI